MRAAIRQPAKKRVQLTGLQEKAGSYRDCCLEEERCRKAAGEAERRWDQVRQKKEAEKQALDKAQEAVAGLAEQAVAAEQAKARWQALSDRLQREGQAASLEEQLKEAGKQWQHSQNFLEKAAAKARTSAWPMKCPACSSRPGRRPGVGTGRRETLPGLRLGGPSHAGRAPGFPAGTA